MNKWAKTALGDLIDIKHGFAFKGEFFQNEPNGNILLTPGNFHIGGGFKSEKFKYYNGEIPEDYVLHGGEIVVTMTDLSKEVDTLGYSAIVPTDSHNKYLHNQRIGLVIPQGHSVNLHFIYWLMRSADYRWHIISSASGSTVSHTSPARIREFTFDLPTPPEQEAIAGILSSLDDKIDLLHRQNQTLEALAQTLFRHWFIDNPEDDWEYIPLGKVVTTMSGGTPSRKKAKYFAGGMIPWVKSKELNGTYILGTEEQITEGGLKSSSAKILPENAILIAMYGATVGQYGILGLPATCNQAVCALLPNENYPYTFLYMFTKFNTSNLINMAVGSAQQNISQVLIKSLDIPEPSPRILEYHYHARPLVERIKANFIQIRILEKLRDMLLHKLMSGEVRVRLSASEQR